MWVFGKSTILILRNTIVLECKDFFPAKIRNIVIHVEIPKKNLNSACELF